MKKLMPNILFHIESERLFDLLEKFNERKLNYERRLPVAKTPYHGIISTIDVSFEEKDLKKFLEIIKEENYKSRIRLYKLKDNYYRPFVVQNENNYLIYTTFFYQKLCNAENFVAQKNDISDYNFLECFEITAKTENEAKGYYRSVAHIPASEYLTNTDTGTFNIKTFNNNNDYTVITNAINIRDIITSYRSFYDDLFSLPIYNGISEFQVIEYYISFMENMVIHFAEDVDIVELYSKDNGVLTEKPMLKFSKSKTSNKLEENVVDIINNFLEQQYGLKRKNTYKVD